MSPGPSTTFIPYLIIGVWVLLIVMVVAIAVSNWRRGKRIEKYALEQGWEYTRNGKAALGKYPAGEPMTVRFGARVRHLVEFEHEGLGVETFEYSYTEGGKKKRRIHIQITAVTMPRTAPYLQVRPERGFDTVRKAFGARDTQFESVGFNDAWLVRGDDERFTHGVIHPRMMEWLMEHSGRNFTLSGALLFGYAYQQFDHEQIRERVNLLADFHRRIPAHVWQGEPVR